MEGFNRIQSLGYFIANSLSISRSALSLSATVGMAFGANNENCVKMLFAAAATDVIDGFIARRTNSETVNGALRDIIADSTVITSFLTIFILNDIEYARRDPLIPLGLLFIASVGTYLARTKIPD